ncbi:MAG: kelch repeat-containing protein [Acidimicrobiia bacterium]
MTRFTQEGSRRCYGRDGVAGPREEPLDDTWSFDYETTNWSNLLTTGPSARGWHLLASDDETNTLVLFGGGASRTTCTHETWLFDTASDSWALEP